VFGVRVSGSVKKKGRGLTNLCSLRADFRVTALKHKAKKAVFVCVSRRLKKRRISSLRKSERRNAAFFQAIAIQFGSRRSALYHQ